MPNTKDSSSKHKLRRSKKTVRTYAPYIAKLVKKNLNNDASITSDAAHAMARVVEDLQGRLGDKCVRVLRASKSRTLKPKHGLVATRLVLPREICGDAAEFGLKAVESFADFKSQAG